MVRPRARTRDGAAGTAARGRGLSRVRKRRTHLAVLAF